MKYNNFFKYIFVIVVIALIIGSVYLVYYKKSSNVESEVDDEETNQVQQISIVENLKMGVQSFDTLNPLLTKNKEIVNIDKLIFEPLVNITSDYHTENCLAKEVTKTSDNVYTIKLNSNIKWQDGGNLISKDIQYTVEQLKNLDSIYSQNGAHIQSVDIPDSETAIITLDQAVPFFEYYLDFPIVSSSYYFNEDFANSTKIPIGTGMYKIASIDNENILLVTNDRWRNIKNSRPKTQSITIHRYNAIGEMFNAFKLGNIDIINTYMSNYSDYVGTMGYNKKEFLGRNFTYISFNCNDGILSDKAVRKAVSMGINKENLVSTLFAGTKSVANTGLDYGSYLNNFEGVVSYNLDQAKKQLQDSGWVYTGNRWQKTIDRYSRKLILSLVVNENDQERVNVANSISNQLNEIGIKINVAKVSPERYYQYLNEKNYQMILTGVDNSINPDLSYFCGQNNLSNYNNADVASEIMDLNKIKDAQKQVNEDVPYLGLYRNKGYVILNANVGGNFNPNSYFTYYNFNEWFRQQ